MRWVVDKDTGEIRNDFIEDKINITNEMYEWYKPKAVTMMCLDARFNYILFRRRRGGPKKKRGLECYVFAMSIAQVFEFLEGHSRRKDERDYWFFIKVV